MNSYLVKIAGLLDNGEGQLAIDTYEADANDLDDDVRQQVLELFSLAMLAEIPGLEQHQDAIQQVALDLEIAQQAIQAYCCNADQSVVRHYLKQLSFQSVFKDFRILLSSQLQQESSQPTQNQNSTLPENSPYHLLAEQIDLHTTQENHSQLASKFLLDAEQWQDQSFAKQAFNWLIEHKQLVPPQIFDRLLANILVDYPEGLDHSSLHDEQIDEFQRFRIMALSSECIGDFEAAAQFWSNCADCDSTSNQPTQLEKQLLYERIDYCYEQLGERSVENQIQRLEQSIRKIPDNPELILKLLDIYRANDLQQQYKALLNQAISQFPKNPDIIAAAVTNATETADFDQAADLAEQLFASGSLNTEARQCLIQSYFNYTARLMLRGQRYVAETLLDRIEQLERPTASGLVPVYRALLHYVSGDEVAAERFVEQACQQSGSYLLIYLHMAIETERLGFKSKYSKKYLKLIQSLTAYQPTVHELVELLVVLKKHVDAGSIQLSQVWPTTSPFLNRLCDEELQLEQLLHCCEILKALELYEDLYGLVQCASQAGMDSAQLQFYRIYGQTQANPARLSADDSSLLELILDQHVEHHLELYSEIIEFLNANLNASSMLPDQDQQSSEFSGVERNVDMNPGDVLKTVKQLFNFKPQSNA